METTSAPILVNEEEEDREELLHFMRVLNAFKAYRKTTLRALESREKSFQDLSEAHKCLLPTHKQTLDETRLCIDCNAAVIKELIQFSGEMFENAKYKEIAEHVPYTSFDSDKVKSTLKQIVRDWSQDGEQERQRSYQPLIDEIVSRLPLAATSQNEESEDISVLVPGCGLGRLAWELAKRGYACQGNEFSFFMLFTSNFIINRTPGTSESEFHQYTIYPWVEKSCNNVSWKDALRPIRFPDVNPALLPSNAKFSMGAGDFLQVYNEAELWDCVATCYFIDTAHNIITYIERIYKILKPGGFWVNLGPLLYHYAGMSNEPSVELSYEEVIHVVKQIGFVIAKEEFVQGIYTNNSRSMLQYEYKCSLLVAHKPHHSDPS